MESSGIDLSSGETIKPLEKDCTYKYLGVLEADNIKHNEIKKEITKEYVARSRRILRSHLYARNKIDTINIYSVAVLRYSAGIVNWTKEDLDNLDRSTRKLMTMHNAHHPKACVVRLYLPRAKRGKDLISARDAVEKEVSGLRSYIDKAEEPLPQNVREANLV